MESPSLKMLKERLNVALRAIIWLTKHKVMFCDRLDLRVSEVISSLFNFVILSLESFGDLC